MSTIIPITLIGENLGKRHLYLNSLVNAAYNRNEDFNIIENLSEKSPIDRFFKIDLASKMKNVNYIIKNLKDDDMLFVKRALKCKWLIENEEIINAKYLEDNLYPEMITTAQTKMQHWVHLNLDDQKRCQDFYEYYYKENFSLAVKFFVKCSKNFILENFSKIVHEPSTKIFKILCEKYSEVAKIFFDLLATDEKLKIQYLDKQKDYFNALKYLLKIEGNLVLDIYEKYFNKDLFKSFSPAATKYIIDNHRTRFIQKPELYTVYLFHLPTLAENLTPEDSKELVIKLARAKYLTNWFSYKKVEPFIKRLKPKDRAEFKKKVFVKKDVGEEVENWPYPLPAPPEPELFDFNTIFDDKQPDPDSYGRVRLPKRPIRKKCGNKHEYVEIQCEEFKVKTLLDRLYDEFRVASFGQTLYELRKRIPTESSPQNREFMMLVLVSKSGGRPDAIASLLQLLAQHCNELANVRAAVIRSLVKRAQVWRLPEEIWNQLLEFGQGLGLDDKPPVADCIEGLHAVVIRSLLLSGKCEPDIRNAFIKYFSDLSNYNLSTNEKKVIHEHVPRLLISIAKEKEDPMDAGHWINKAVETLTAYKIKLETYPGLIESICELAEKSEFSVDYIIINLFKSKIARKQLFRYTFNIIITDTSYVNALRHDLTVIDVKKLADYFTGNFITKAEQFFIKLSIYFSEENGLASKFVTEFKERGFNKIFCRLLAILLGDKLESYLTELRGIKNKESKVFAATVKANAYFARPSLNIDDFGFKNAGVQFVANKIIICRSIDINNNIEKLLTWKKTAKLAFALSKRTNNETDIFLKFADIRPKAAMKSGLKYVKQRQDNVDITIWKKIKPVIEDLDINSDNLKYFVVKLAAIKKVPVKIRAEYSTVIYTLFRKKSFDQAMPPLCHAEILILDVNENFIETVLREFLADGFDTSQLCKQDKNKRSNILQNTCLHIRVLIKFLFISKDIETQKDRWHKFGIPFLAKMEDLNKLQTTSNYASKIFKMMLDEMFLSFKFSKVFLNTGYVSPLYVMENTLMWMKKLFPMEKHFDMYSKLHLTMLLYKSVRQGVKQFPNIFSDENKTRKEGVEIVGNFFGQYIAREVKILTEKYFVTITELYAKSLISYLEDYNNHCISSVLLSSIHKGILNGSKGYESLVGIYLMVDKSSYLNNSHCKEVKDTVKSITDPEVKWIAFSEIFA